jgi:CheY-like chemotaxis protein
VLLVEDDKDAREMYSLALELGGMVVRSETSVDAALRTAIEWRPDIIVTDFLLHGHGTGADLCRTLHADPATAGIPIVVMTGISRAPDVESIVQAGCAEIRIKPYLPDALVQDVKALTATTRGRRTA